MSPPATQPSKTRARAEAATREAQRRHTAAKRKAAARRAAAHAAAAQHREQARLDRIAARQRQEGAALLPPVASPATQVPIVVVESRAVPQAAVVVLITGLLLFLTAGLLPDRMLAPIGRTFPTGARIGASVLGLAGVVVGLAMFFAAA